MRLETSRKEKGDEETEDEEKKKSREYAGSFLESTT